MFCKYCGAQLKDNSKFCASCGAKLESDSSSARTVRPNTTYANAAHSNTNHSNTAIPNSAIPNAAVPNAKRNVHLISEILSFGLDVLLHLYPFSFRSLPLLSWDSAKASPFLIQKTVFSSS